LIKLNSKYQPLFNSDTRFFIITGGRGSSKSFAVGTFTNLLSFESNHTILFSRQTMTSAHLSIIPEFQEKIDLMELNDFFSVTKTEIINRQSASKIIFRGIKTSSGDQTANLKSLQGVTTWILDEAEELTNEATFDKINLSIRQKGKQNRVILILNPATKTHWIYQRFFEQQGVKEGFNGIKNDVTYIHTTYQDNIENLDVSFLNEVERIRTVNPDKYRHTILGGWLDKAEGVVFTNWTFGEFNPDNLQVSCGMDFGFSVDPDALCEVAIDKKHMKLYVRELIYQKGIKTHELAVMILNKVGNKLIIADSAEPRLIEDLKHKGVNIQAVKKGTVESGIMRMQDFQIIVEPSSVNFAKELNNYAYRDKGSQLYIDDYNHLIDSCRYNVIYHLDNPNKGNYSVY
jgi:phage terminase large subunit